jgi:hypothetical protein
MATQEEGVSVAGRHNTFRGRPGRIRGKHFKIGGRDGKKEQGDKD